MSHPSWVQDSLLRIECRLNYLHQLLQISDSIYCSNPPPDHSCNCTASFCLRFWPCLIIMTLLTYAFLGKLAAALAEDLCSISGQLLCKIDDIRTGNMSRLRQFPFSRPSSSPQCTGTARMSSTRVRDCPAQICPRQPLYQAPPPPLRLDCLSVYLIRLSQQPQQTIKEVLSNNWASCLSCEHRFRLGPACPPRRGLASLPVIGKLEHLCFQGWARPMLVQRHLLRP